MERYIRNLRRREGDAGSICQMLSPQVVNQHIAEWLREMKLCGDL